MLSYVSPDLAFTILKNLTGSNVRQADLVEATGVTRAAMSYRAKNNSVFPLEDIIKIEHFFNVNLLHNQTIKNNITDNQSDDFVKIIFRPDVNFSSGYKIVTHNQGEYITLDKKIFKSERGTEIDPNYCEIIAVSGNSLYPKWEEGDRFILDKSVNKFIDGQIFAFKHNDEYYIKEICLLGKRAKAIFLIIFCLSLKN